MRHRLKYKIEEIRAINQGVARQIKKADLIVDALFGVGLNRAILGPFRNIIEGLNNSGKRIVSVDIPSGLDGTTGKIYGVCIKSYQTVSFNFVKQGFLRNDGPKYVGKIVVAGIGIPEKILKKR